MCKFSSKSGGVPFQPLGDLTWNDPHVLHTGPAILGWIGYYPTYPNSTLLGTAG